MTDHPSSPPPPLALPPLALPPGVPADTLTLPRTANSRLSDEDIAALRANVLRLDSRIEALRAKQADERRHESDPRAKFGMGTDSPEVAQHLLAMDVLQDEIDALERTKVGALDRIDAEMSKREAEEAKRQLLDVRHREGLRDLRSNATLIVATIAALGTIIRLIIEVWR